eukprot:TRINITY_DN22172_c0_g1_i1.p1 TRINITY_DN22172_c0_g1~~TRINITY_DN22172_c0_g1_i1.p1  ORF type:complete len:160 (-),score=25.89 TRINITY_DN22172_c0_g1_i1:466-876(-)
MFKKNTCESKDMKSLEENRSDQNVQYDVVSLAKKYGYPYDVDSGKSHKLDGSNCFNQDGNFPVDGLLEVTAETALYSLGTFNGLFMLFVGSKGYHLIDSFYTVWYFLGQNWDDVVAYMQQDVQSSLFKATYIDDEA